MLRQRIRVESSTVATLAARALAALIGLALAFYGLMLFLLAVKVDPDTVNGLSGYRDAFDYLAGLTAGDISVDDRRLAALAGLVVGLAAAYLAWRAFPRPHLARHSRIVSEGERGHTEVQPRALERAVEVAALAHPDVVAARARYDEESIVLAVTAGGATRLVETLREVGDLARESLARHQLNLHRVDVTLTGYNRSNRRELA